MNKIIQFFRDVRIEAAKVNWPTRQELIGSTIVVAIVSLILSAFTGVVDLVLSRLAAFVLK